MAGVKYENMTKAWGEVVGVNSQIYSRTGGFMGLSFAVPINVVTNVYEQLRDKGFEYGSTTGRARRCGWLDIPALKYAARCMDLTEKYQPIMKDFDLAFDVGNLVERGLQKGQVRQTHEKTEVG